MRRRLLVAIVAIAAIVIALVSLHQYRRLERARQADERAAQMEKEADKAARSREEASRLLQQAEARAREEQARIAIERLEQIEREASSRAEEERRATQADRDRQEQQRRAAERARDEQERRLAEQERQAEQQRLAAERENARLEEERRRRAELETRQEAEERARRKAELAAEEEARAGAAAVQVPEEADDDTPDVETETTVSMGLLKKGWKVSGDLRPIMDGLREESRDGATESDAAPGIRARIGVDFGITRWISVGTRIAGTGFAGNFNPNFILPGNLQDDSELESGTIGFDQLYLRWQRKESFSLAVGRLQTRFQLRGGVYAKSLDRNNSHNWRVNWTDGLQATLKTGDWRTSFVFQANPRSGPTGVRRYPLDFDDDGARLTYFLASENFERKGVLVQRAFDINYLPASLLKDGESDGRRTDYWGLVGRLMCVWPPEKEGLRLRAGPEIGYAPETPTYEAQNLRGSGDVSGLAWNVVISAIDFAPAHSIGVNYGRTGAGWLLSPQYRPNEELIEIRHMWRPERFPLLESRIRRRQELDQLVDTIQRRTQYDFFVRLTWRFTIKE